MRKFLSCVSYVVLIFFSQALHAQKAPPVYAVLSLVGDQLGVVVASRNPDMNFAPYRRTALPIDTAMFDDGVVSAAGIAIRKAVPGAELSALQTRSPVLFEKQRALFEENGGAIAVPEAIKAAVQQQKAGYLLLVTKHRDDIKLRFDNKRRDNNSATLEGLGFYVDDSAQSGIHERGFIAPYAYLRVALIDAGTWNVISRETIVASSAMPGIIGKSAPVQWQLMTAQQKAQSVDTLLRAEITRVIPLLLKTG